MKNKIILCVMFLTFVFVGCDANGAPTPKIGDTIIDHRCTKLEKIPLTQIQAAREQLIIAYGHTSHGSQLVDGMTGLVGFKGTEYQWNDSGAGGALQLLDTPFSGASDLGSDNWDQSTKNYLNAHSEVNVVIWSWCGQVSNATEDSINTYLNTMSQLERDFPGVKFVYMTGHLDGSGLNGNLHRRNEQIRDYCRRHQKFLYDFADIESYNPDGVYFGDKNPDDECNYDRVNDEEGNWASEWQNTHSLGVHWYQINDDAGPAHTQHVNGNMKAYAAWWLWARLAGWGGV